MELLLLLLSLYSLLNSLYFPGWWNITLFLTGCLCALNYMSKPDHLILLAVYGKFRQTSTGYSIIWQQNGTTATVSEMNSWCLHKMPDMNNNTYIAWLYIRGIPAILPALGPYCTCPTDACNMVLASGGFRGGTPGPCPPPLLKPFCTFAPPPFFVHVPPPFWNLKKKKNVSDPPPPPPLAKYLFPNRFIYGAVLSQWIAQLMNRFIPSIHHITQRLVCGVIGKALRCGTEVWEFDTTHGPKSFALFSL